MGCYKKKYNRKEPAYSVVTLLGGPKALSLELEMTPAAIYQWMSSSKYNPNGLDGRIPRRHHEKILALAKVLRKRIARKTLEA